ncbi:MAG: hypothetical protein M0Z69_15820 [Actinomycetota bacterium]|nr:hypothetical protein [Actinomycetota bacterium]
MSAVVHTEQLTDAYGGADSAAVDRRELDVLEGEIFGLLGPNDAGRTTTGDTRDGLHQPHGKGAAGLMATTAPSSRSLLGHARLVAAPRRSVVATSWVALGALLLRDLVVLRKYL